MSTQYDIENLLADVKSILQANLNTKIAAIEAEKIAQGFIATNIAAVDSSTGYFQQSWSDAILNVSPALYFGVEQVQAIGMGPNTAEKITVFVELIYMDSGLDTLGNTRINRYTRAIKEVLQDNYDQFRASNQIKIETVRPSSFKLDSGSSEEYKIGGVSLTTSIV